MVNIMIDTEQLKGVAGRYWHRLEDGRIQCDVCPRFCKLNEGQRGLCFVRGRQGDQIVLTTYGRSSGFCVDPIEKKPLNHFLPGTPVLSFGTAGCNLTCKFCQNWDVSKARAMDRLQDEASPEDIVRAAIATGSRSIAYTYNDPVIFLEYAVDVAKVAREHGIKNVAVTAGYVGSGAREELYSWMDAANVDLKAFSEEFYKRLCAGHLGAVLETLEYLKRETKVWFEITTLLIPGHNDGAQEVRELSEWVLAKLGPDVPLHFTAFHPDYKMLDVPHTPPRTLTLARDIARGDWAPLRLHGQRARRGRWEYVLPMLWHPRNRPRLVRNYGVAPDRRWLLQRVRHRDRRRLRGEPRRLGPAAHAGSDWRWARRHGWSLIPSRADIRCSRKCPLSAQRRR